MHSELVEHAVDAMEMDARARRLFYIVGLSSNTLIYKGMLQAKQLSPMFPDLAAHFRALARGRVAQLDEDLLQKIDNAVGEGNLSQLLASGSLLQRPFVRAVDEHHVQPEPRYAEAPDRLAAH